MINPVKKTVSCKTTICHFFVTFVSGFSHTLFATSPNLKGDNYLIRTSSETSMPFFTKVQFNYTILTRNASYWCWHVVLEHTAFVTPCGSENAKPNRSKHWQYGCMIMLQHPNRATEAGRYLHCSSGLKASLKKAWRPSNLSVVDLHI